MGWSNGGVRPTLGLFYTFKGTCERWGECLGASDQHWDCFRGTCEGWGGAPGGVFEHIDLDHLELNCSVSLLVNRSRPSWAELFCLSPSQHACTCTIYFILQSSSVDLELEEKQLLEMKRRAEERYTVYWSVASVDSVIGDTKRRYKLVLKRKCGSN